jgi:hypothetical protein
MPRAELNQSVWFLHPLCIIHEKNSRLNSNPLMFFFLFSAEFFLVTLSPVDEHIYGHSHRFWLNLANLLSMSMTFTSKNFSSKFVRGWVLQGCKVLGKICLPRWLKTPIFSWDILKNPTGNDPHEQTHLFHLVTFYEGQRSISLILAN